MAVAIGIIVGIIDPCFINVDNLFRGIASKLEQEDGSLSLVPFPVPIRLFFS